MNDQRPLKGSVGISMGVGWIPKTIAWFLRSNYSHTFLVLHEGHGHEEDGAMIFEANIHGVAIDVFDDHQKKTKLIELYEPRDIEVGDAIKAVWRKYHYKRYGFLQLAGFALVIVLRRLGIEIRNPLGGGIICSELIWEYLKELGFDDLYAERDRNTVSPGDVKDALDRLVGQGKFRKAGFVTTTGGHLDVIA